MLGTSGTVTTIAGVYLRLRRYDRRRVDGCWLSDDEISRVVDELMAMSFDERAANPCIGAERADLVLAGCAILDAIRRAFPCAAAARRRSRPARRHAGRDDARGRRVGRGVSGHGDGLRMRSAARCHRAPGSNASSAIPMWRAPSAKACARARPTSSPKSTTNIACSSTARASSISAPRQAAGAKSRRKRVGADGPRDRARHSRHEADRGRRIPASGFSRRDRAGSAQGDARRQGRRRALRHGGERDRPPADRSFAHHGAGGGRGAISPAKCSPRGGAFLCKVLQGGTEAALLAELKRDFESVKHVKPPASRTDSAELYLLARGFRHRREAA